MTFRRSLRCLTVVAVLVLGSRLHGQASSPRPAPDATPAAQGNAGNASPAADLPVSIARVRQGLERNPAIELAIGTAIAGGAPPGRPVFRTKTEERFDLDKAYALAHPPSPPPPPPMGIDLLALIRGGVSNAMRAYRERQARANYQTAMEDWCSAFPEQARTLPACLELQADSISR